MRTPRSRRALLTAVVSISAAIAGCSEGQLSGPSDDTDDSETVSADAYDCADVDRPTPDPPARDDALESASYPDRPASLLEDADRFVREFETAYRRNAFLEEYGSETRAFDFRFRSHRTDEVTSSADREAVLVALVYDLSAETRQAVNEEWSTRVTYYVDDRVAFRARHDGVASDPAFEPDPRSAADPVVCFD